VGAAFDKKENPRKDWFVKNFGNRCWELDALDPNDLRARVETEILKHVEPEAWLRCKVVERAEQDKMMARCGRVDSNLPQGIDSTKKTSRPWRRFGRQKAVLST
jgi:hypothetical protein